SRWSLLWNGIGCFSGRYSPLTRPRRARPPRRRCGPGSKTATWPASAPPPPWPPCPPRNDGSGKSCGPRSRPCSARRTRINPDCQGPGGPRPPLTEQGGRLRPNERKENQGQRCHLPLTNAPCALPSRSKIRDGQEKSENGCRLGRPAPAPQGRGDRLARCRRSPPPACASAGRSPVGSRKEPQPIRNGSVFLVRLPP